MSIREQERRQKQAEKRINGQMRRADKEVRGAMDERSRQADLRAKEIVRRIEKGDADPRPLPGLREDSLESMESMKSMESSGSMKSMESADPVMEVNTDGAEAHDAGKGMPLEEHVPFNAAEMEEDLAGQMTEDTGAGGDMTEHAERKVAQHGEEMLEE